MIAPNDWMEKVSETDRIILYRTPSTEEAQRFVDREDVYGFSLKGWKVFWAQGKVDGVCEYVVFDPRGKPMHTSPHMSSVMQYIDLKRIDLRTKAQSAEVFM